MLSTPRDRPLRELPWSVSKREPFNPGCIVKRLDKPTTVYPDRDLAILWAIQRGEGRSGVEVLNAELPYRRQYIAHALRRLREGRFIVTGADGYETTDEGDKRLRFVVVGVVVDGGERWEAYASSSLSLGECVEQACALLEVEPDDAGVQVVLEPITLAAPDRRGITSAGNLPAVRRGWKQPGQMALQVGA